MGRRNLKELLSWCIMPNSSDVRRRKEFPMTLPAAAALAQEILGVARKAHSEEDVRVGVERALAAVEAEVDGAAPSVLT
jgi:hypothetical protein